MGRKITWGICCIQYHLRIRTNIGRETSKELKNHCNNGTTAFWKNEEAWLIISRSPFSIFLPVCALRGQEAEKIMSF